MRNSSKSSSEPSRWASSGGGELVMGILTHILPLSSYKELFLNLQHLNLSTANSAHTDREEMSPTKTYLTDKEFILNCSRIFTFWNQTDSAKSLFFSLLQSPSAFTRQKGGIKMRRCQGGDRKAGGGSRSWGNDGKLNARGGEVHFKRAENRHVIKRRGDSARVWSGVKISGVYHFTG